MFDSRASDLGSKVGSYSRPNPTRSEMKRCYKCNTVKPHSDFNNNVNRYDGLQTYCRACQKLIYKNRYDSITGEKERLLLRNSERRERNRLYIRSKKNHPCMDCGVQYPHYVMDFDHRENKLFNVSRMVTGFSLEAIDVEIEKCDLVCSNCHRIRTWGSRSLVV